MAFKGKTDRNEMSGLCVAGVYFEPGLERPQISAAAVLFDPENGGQGARHPAVQVRAQRSQGSATCVRAVQGKL